MYKKRKIDFILYEDDYGKLIFRFYPRQSSCHSFNDEPPKSWKEVYKVYYNYGIIKQYKECSKCIESVVLFHSDCDECSIIDKVSARIKLITEGNKTIIRTWRNEEYMIDLFEEKFPLGMGVSWKINEHKGDMYTVEMFNWNDVGYRFCLNKDRLKKFGEYLKYCCEYMLSVGEPI